VWEKSMIKFTPSKTNKKKGYVKGVENIKYKAHTRKLLLSM
jgi:hypothetical protein